ncbi:MAG TPA: SCO family protein [Stellaceae bacterium]|jgi:protein SCO1/2|nr:SCO family protein [Stellaceae bacterium]
MARDTPGETPSGGTPSAPDRRSSRFMLAAAGLAVVVILGSGVLVGLELRNGEHGVAGTVLGRAVGGPFRLTDQNGKTVTDASLHGKWLLVYFGYTHCPDACPTALNNIALALDKLGPKRGQFRPVFITIDPARDTPQALKDYVAAFGAPILALTGTDTEIAQAAKEYHVYYAKHEENGGDYSVDHTSVVYVMDPQGRFAAGINSETPPEDMAAKLKKLVG